MILYFGFNHYWGPEKNFLNILFDFWSLFFCSYLIVLMQGWISLYMLLSQLITLANKSDAFSKSLRWQEASAFLYLSLVVCLIWEASSSLISKFDLLFEGFLEFLLFDINLGHVHINCEFQFADLVLLLFIDVFLRVHGHRRLLINDP